MRIGLGVKADAWDGSNIDQKLVDLLNEFYVPTTACSVYGYILANDKDIMEDHASAPGYIERKDAIEKVREGIESTKHLMDLAAKRIEAAEDELRAVISTCGSKTGCFAGYDTYEEYLKSEHWQTVRREALQKYDGKCALDSKHEEAVHVHHRTYGRLGAELPEDVIVLCSGCHTKHHDAENDI